jgi:hypothetical protein
MSETNGQIQCKGDFGNPSGTGLASISVYDLVDEVHADVKTKLTTFHAALVTAQFTATVKCDTAVNFVDPDYKVKPGADVNVDRRISVTWRKKTETAIRRLTIPGVPTTSTAISDTDAGERINDTGRTALQAALEALYDLTAGDVIVLSGIVTQKK